MGAFLGQTNLSASPHMRKTAGPDLSCQPMGRFSGTYRIALAGLMLFAAGFLLLHGRVAEQSGSWRYTITHDDEYAFWVIADGFAQSPRSDANPFYAEHAGLTNPILSYPTVAIVGTLSGWFDVPVLTLFPLWKVGAPFLAWLAIWLCLSRIWGFREGPSAAISLCVLAGTLLMHGSAQHLLLRFSRPVDMLAPAALWLSCALNPGALRGRTAWGTGIAVAVVLLASPFLAVFCTITTWCAWLWSRRIRTDPMSRRVLTVACLASAFGFVLLLYTMGPTVENQWMSAALGHHDGDLVGANAASILLLGVAIAAVVGRHRRRDIARADVVLLCVLGIEPLAANVHLVMGRGFGFEVHRYYYLVFEVLAVLGWLADTIPVRPPGGRLYRWEVPVVAACTASVLWMVSTPATNFLRLLPRAQPTNAPYDNGLLLLQLLPLLLVLVWLVRRTALSRLSHTMAGPLGCGIFVCLCFVTWPPHQQQVNDSVPFFGAHTWLAEHAAPGEVVMTLPPDYGLYDYAPLYSPAKVYYNPYGLVADSYEREYRKSVYFALYCGILDQPGIPIQASLADRLREFKLDYILAWKGPLNDRWRRQTAPQLPPLKGRVDASVARQLGSLLEVAYQDGDCVLWRVITGH